jgi:hypothetical protein
MLDVANDALDVPQVAARLIESNVQARSLSLVMTRSFLSTDKSRVACSAKLAELWTSAQVAPFPQATSRT